MDQFDIYVNVERPPANRGKKKSLVKCSGNIFEHEDHSLEPNTTEAALSGNEHMQRVPASTYYNRMLTVDWCKLMCMNVNILYSNRVDFIF